MLPFRIEIQSGESPFRQIVYAATRAIVSGELAVGAPFPSVRALSQSLKVNPNTAQKAVRELVAAGLLEVHPGVGTVVAEWGPALPAERARLLAEDVERLVVEARRVGMTRGALVESVASAWAELFDDIGTRAGPSEAEVADDEERRA